MSAESALFRFTVDQFERMGAAGVFRPGERVELVDGEIYDTAPIGPPHAWCVDRLAALLIRGVDPASIVRVQNPAVLGARTEVQPDIILMRGPEQRYRKAHPTTADVLLLIEVSDTTLRFDRDVKVPVYAREGIREVWIVDLDNSRVDVYRQPTAHGYTSVEVIERDATLVPASFPDLEIAVGDVLP